jgi:hypothetical protein
LAKGSSVKLAYLRDHRLFESWISTLASEKRAAHNALEYHQVKNDVDDGSFIVTNLILTIPKKICIQWSHLEQNFKTGK